MRPRHVAPVGLVGALVLVVAVAGSFAAAVPVRDDVPGAPTRAPRSFAFAAAGDLGANRHTAAALRRLDRSDARFFIALGDLDYDETTHDTAWCDYVHRHLPRKGPRFPFELVAGNHEQDGGPDGRLRNFTRCLPDRLDARIGPRSSYGAEYRFDYPRAHPLARFVLVSPRLEVDGVRYSYHKGSPHRRWLLRQIAGARRSGVPWVVVGMHFPCLTTGQAHSCDSGPQLMNLLLRKRVDLVLAGHNHTYERSWPLRLRRPGCRKVRPYAFDGDCVGRSRRHTVRQGAGTVLLTAGTVGGRHQGIRPRAVQRGYFAARSGTARGFVRYTVSRRTLSARFVSSYGGFEDSFRIVR
jgi:hypothetical protein